MQIFSNELLKEIADVPALAPVRAAYIQGLLQTPGALDQAISHYQQELNTRFVWAVLEIPDWVITDLEKQKPALKDVFAKMKLQIKQLHSGTSPSGSAQQSSDATLESKPLFLQQHLMQPKCKKLLTPLWLSLLLLTRAIQFHLNPAKQQLSNQAKTQNPYLIKKSWLQERKLEVIYLHLSRSNLGDKIFCSQIIFMNLYPKNSINFSQNPIILCNYVCQPFAKHLDIAYEFVNSQPNFFFPM